MKKRIILVLLLMVVLVGCIKKEVKKHDWVIDKTTTKQVLSDEVMEIFENAKSNYNGELDYVALLAKQVVAGTNYMFLCQDEEGYKIGIVYNNLDNVSQLTVLSPIDIVKYVNENYELSNDSAVGGWTVDIPDNVMELPLSVRNYFNDATSTLTGVSYYPIALLAHQDNSGTNYAIICYSEGSYRGSNTGISLLTLYVDKKNKAKIVSSAAVDLAEYNK